MTVEFENGLRYEVDEQARTVRSVFPDGTEALGVASFTAEDVARARSLGYQGSDDEAAWAMHREHDLAHHLAMRALGWPWSQVLWFVAHGQTQRFPAGVYQTEERLAFLLQRAGNEGLLALVRES